MKIYFQPNQALWDPARYHYAAEQMMLTLFPGEKPEYPEEEPDINTGADWVVFSLAPGDKTALLSAALERRGRRADGRCGLSMDDLRDTPERVYHVIQHALKMAFYRAGTTLLGGGLPWGALTGVRPVKLPTRSMLAGATPRQAQKELEESYCVSPERAALAVDCAQASLAVQRALAPGEVSLYLGIPFCPTRCAYCSFVSADVGRTLKLVEPYLDGVFQEIDATARALGEAGLSIRSLYVGGGTPTTLSAEQMDRLLSRCEELLPLGGCTEYTVEAGRPDTITREKLEVLKAHGIGRISINPQTLEDHVLEAIGRKHSAGDIPAAYELARSVGFSCINMDLIAGLPRDSFKGFRRSLEGVLELKPENVTVHTLALKKGSRLMEDRRGSPVGERMSGETGDLSRRRESEGHGAYEDEAAQMLDFSREVLRQWDYRPYYLYRQKYMSGSLENVGWAVPGTESLYNIVMMEELHTVVSIGGGGVTKLVNPRSGKIVRLPNPKYPHDYLAGLDKVLIQKREIPMFYQEMGAGR